MSGWRRGFLGAAALVLAASAPAAGLDRLKAFVAETRSGSADFVQQVTDRDGKTQPPTSGHMQFSRPGRFRWEYAKPYRQTIVGDGERLWLWDPDLNQVTTRKMADALGSSPAALLAGDNALEKGFVLADGAARDGLDWVDARPRNADSGFESIRLGFSGAVLARMELSDTFGQTTRIQFSHQARNPALTDDAFHFVPPAGADVISDPGTR